MHILIVTHFFPPLNEIGSLRPYYFAKYWAESGHKITVVTSKKYLSDGSLDLVRNMHPGITVIEVDYPARFFWQPHSNAASLSNIKNGPGKKSIVKKLKSQGRKVLNLFGTLLDPFETWTQPATEACIEVIRENKPDVLVTSFSPRAVNEIARNIKKAHPDIFWVADYRDLWSQNHISKAMGVLNRFERSAEINTVGKHSDMITVVSEPLKEELELLMKQPVAVITNGFDPEDYEGIEPSGKITDAPVNILYTGTIYSGRRDPAPLFMALNELEREGSLREGDVKVLFYSRFQGDLQDIIDRNQAAKWAEIKGQTAHRNAIALQKSAEMLLFLESSAPDAKGVLTGKLFEYLVAGVPVLGVGITADVISGKLILETNSGWACGNSVPEIKSAVLSILQKKYLYQPDMEIINRYTRQETANQMLKAIKRFIDETKR